MDHVCSSAVLWFISCCWDIQSSWVIQSHFCFWPAWPSCESFGSLSAVYLRGWVSRYFGCMIQDGNGCDAAWGHEDKQTCTLTPQDLEPPLKLTCVFLDCGGKTCACREREWNLHTEKSHLGFEQGPSCCKATVNVDKQEVFFFFCYLCLCISNIVTLDQYLQVRLHSFLQGLLFSIKSLTKSKYNISCWDLI